VLIDYATKAGFNCTQAESLKDHYIPTLEIWASKLEANRARAIELTSQEAYDNYMHYLTGCEKLFRTGHIDVMQFTPARTDEPQRAQYGRQPWKSEHPRGSPAGATETVRLERSTTTAPLGLARE
jgi:hypothetical protein